MGPSLHIETAKCSLIHLFYNHFLVFIEHVNPCTINLTPTTVQHHFEDDTLAIYVAINIWAIHSVLKRFYSATKLESYHYIIVAVWYIYVLEN